MLNHVPEFEEKNVTEKTESEALFEQFCDDNGISWKRIDSEDSKTPDYEASFGNHCVIIEIKQLDPNKEELRVRERGRESGRASYWPAADRRVRNKIGSARKQLKAYSDGMLPTMLVLYDNVPFNALDSCDIITAMYGDEVARFAVPEYSVEPTVLVNIGVGGGRKLTPSTNTTISAVAWLHQRYGVLNLVIYHNIYAKNPIDPDWLRRDTVRHYCLTPEVPGTWHQLQTC